MKKLIGILFLVLTLFIVDYEEPLRVIKVSNIKQLKQAFDSKGPRLIMFEAPEDYIIDSDNDGYTDMEEYILMVSPIYGHRHSWTY